MKKLVLLLAALVGGTAAVLTGCGGGSSSPPTAPKDGNAFAATYAGTNQVLSTTSASGYLLNPAAPAAPVFKSPVTLSVVSGSTFSSINLSSADPTIDGVATFTYSASGNTANCTFSTVSGGSVGSLWKKVKSATLKYTFNGGASGNFTLSGVFTNTAVGVASENGTVNGVFDVVAH